MKRFLLVFAVFAVLFFSAFAFLGVPRIQAKQDRPQITCNPCVAEQQWSGSQTGALTTVYVPSLSASGTNYIARYIEEDNSNYTVVVGYDYNDDFNGCGDGSTGTGQFFYVVINTNGTCLYDNAFPYHSGDTAHTAELGTSISGDGVDIWIHQTGSGISPCNPCHLANVTNTFSLIILEENIKWTWTGTLQGTYHWTKNQYHNSTGFHYQFVAGNLYDDPGLPWDWNPAPAVGNNGGNLFACDKDSGSC
jgi:hypothetical protein